MGRFWKGSFWVCVLVFLFHVAWLLAPVSGFAGQWPSLFRGVVVADSPVGVRVVSVEESSQAFHADLRAEDLIISIDGHEVRSIDEFAATSLALKGRAALTTVLVFRHGVPREIQVHLYSYPILQRWGVEFIPEHDLHFAEPQVGLEYWARLGRGFEEARNPAEALKAYLNGLHNVPTDDATALNVAELFSRLGQQQVQAGQLREGMTSLRDALLMMEQLFHGPLTDAQLETIKRQLEDTLHALRATRSVGP